MSNQTIYNALRAAGLTKEGACALMGNMRAESGMRPDIAQRGMTRLTDAQYTAAVDAGTIDFARDAVGYGLCQWTYRTRKAELLAFARERGVSVGDEQTQVQFCLRELKRDFASVWALLTGSHGLYECARAVCVEFERPAVNNVETRYRYAQEFYEQMNPPAAAALPSAGEIAPDLSVLVMQAVMRFNGYEAGADGRKSAVFFEKLREFTADMEAC